MAVKRKSVPAGKVASKGTQRRNAAQSATKATHHRAMAVASTKPGSTGVGATTSW